MNANYDINKIRKKKPKSLGKIPDCRVKAEDKKTQSKTL